MDNLINIVGKLNSRLYDNHGNTEHFYSLSSTGYCNLILFGDVVLWSSENEMREFNEDTGEYEDLEKFVKKELKKIGKMFQKYSK